MFLQYSQVEMASLSCDAGAAVGHQPSWSYTCDNHHPAVGHQVVLENASCLPKLVVDPYTVARAELRTGISLCNKSTRSSNEFPKAYNGTSCPAVQ